MCYTYQDYTTRAAEKSFHPYPYCACHSIFTHSTVTQKTSIELFSDLQLILNISIQREVTGPSYPSAYSNV